jgi:hypothetical protein
MRKRYLFIAAATTKSSEKSGAPKMNYRMSFISAAWKIFLQPFLLFVEPQNLCKIVLRRNLER